MSKNFNSTIAGATILLLILTLVSRGFGFIREILLAGYFGTGTEFESYLVGAVLPLTINTVILYIILNYFIPVYHRQKTSEKKSLFVSRIFFLFTGISIVLSSLMFLLTDLVLKVYTGSDIPDVNTVTVYRIMLLTIPLNTGYSVLSAYLNAEYKYSYPAYSQLIFNVISILILILFHDSINILVIPVSQLGGYLIQVIYVYMKSAGSIKLFRKVPLFNKKILSGSGQFIFFIMLVESLNQLYVVLDRYYYEQVETGGIAALNYGMTIFLLPLAVISSAFSTVIFPRFSEAFNNGRYKELDKFYRKSLLYNTVIYVPVVLLFLLGGEFIIKILFERGRFDSVSTAQTFGVLQIYSVSLLFYASYAIISKMIFSLGLVKQLFIISVICLATKAAFNEILVHPYQQNGLAISSSISYIIMSIAGYLIVNNKLRTIKDGNSPASEIPGGKWEAVK